MIDTRKVHIDDPLVRKLIATQFPQWANLPIKPIANSGWDNRTFHLGDRMIVRMPSAAEYSQQVEKEHLWLPKLAPHLPLPIPKPLLMGCPTEEYPWYWSIYEWLDGEPASYDNITDLNQFAMQLAKFLTALQQIDASGGPVAGPHNFYRGGFLRTYDKETRKAIAILGDKIDKVAARSIWDSALASIWQRDPVWVHGDIVADNLLVEKGRLSAVIDFGCLGVGDPACDLAVAWTFFDSESRDVFRKMLQLDKETWNRGRGWALWKALIIYAGLPGTNPLEIEKSRLIIGEILSDDNHSG